MTPRREVVQFPSTPHAPAIRIYCRAAEEIEGGAHTPQRFTTPANLRPRGAGMSNAPRKESMAIPLSGKTLLNGR